MNGMVEEGLKKIGLEWSVELGLGVELLFGIGVRRGISGVVRWVGEGSLGEKY